jgi:hypothetical protein
MLALSSPLLKGDERRIWWLGGGEKGERGRGRGGRKLNPPHSSLKREDETTSCGGVLKC